jgi:hypothetical protein
MLSCNFATATVLYFLRPANIRKVHPEIVENHSQQPLLPPAFEKQHSD